MRSGRWRWAAGAGAVLLLAFALIAMAFTSVATPATVALARIAGFQISYDRLSVGSGGASGTNVSVRNAAGEPLLSAGSFDVRYSVGDALRGKRLYGIESFDLEKPHLTLLRHRDGTWNVPLPKGGTSGPGAPFDLTGTIHGGSIAIVDEAQGVPSARHLAFDKIEAQLTLASNARSSYTARIAYEEAGMSYPVLGRGTIDAAAGYGFQRWTAANMPIAHLVDVGLNSPSMHVAGGSLRNLDARIVGLRGASGFDQHVEATASLDRARIAIGGLVKPLRDVHGELALYRNGLLLRSVRATIAGIPIALGGGIYDLSDPHFRLTVDGHGDLHQLRGVIAQSSALPIGGLARLNVLVDGRASKPLISIGLQSPRVRYANAWIGNPRALIAFDGQEADIVDLRARYTGIDVRARGKVQLHSGPRALEIIAGIDAPANTVPYAAAVTAGMPIEASILASSDSLRTVDGRGILYGRTRNARLDGIFDVAGNGVGTVGPIRVSRSDGSSMFAIGFLDRQHRRVDGLVDARRFVVGMPQYSGTIDGRLAGSYLNGAVRAGGGMHAVNVRTPYATIARADARFGTTSGNGVSLALDASGIGALGAVATAIVSYAGGTVHVRDATASARGAFVDASGSIANVTSSAPRYDLNARLHAADLRSVVAVAQPQSARLIEGSASASVHVAGSGAAPALSGTLLAPEGAVNGLAFHGLDARFDGTPQTIGVRGGSVNVGTTAVAFNGSFGASASRVSVRAPRADLSDFNDFFDQGDMLAGTGSVVADAAVNRGAIAATSGALSLHAAGVRNFDFGAAQARWNTTGDRVNTDVALAGTNGTIRARGAVTTRGDIISMNVRARNVNVGNWIAMAGHAMPVAGLADADATFSGRYPSFSGAASAHVRNGAVGRVPVDHLDVAVALSGSRGTLRGLTLTVPHAVVTGSGSFGLRANDALALRFDGRTADVGALSRTLSGKAADAAGAVRTAMTVTGTRANPRIDDRFDATNLRYGRMNVPRIAGEIRADRQTIGVARTEVDLQRGRLILAGTLPIALSPLQIDPHDRPISFALTADDVDVANVLPLLPSGTRATGRLDGRVVANGTVHAPQFGGLLTFAGGSFSSPLETVPLNNIHAELALAGTSVALRNASANAGGGTIVADGRASVPDIHDTSHLAAALNVTARNARIDAPAYVKGTFNGNLHITKAPGSRALLDGTVATDSARIPMTALYNPKPPNAPAVAPPDLGLNLHVVAGRDVRVQSPNVDVGAEGAIDVAGTLANPALSGAVNSTGGTVSFYRNFVVQSGTVTFDPSSGIIPTVDAVATTYVDNPPTDIALHVTGPATQLNIAFDSSPQYDRTQILGLLVNAQAFGAVSGVASTSPSSGFSATNAVGSLAQGQLNQLFTRNMLEPLSVAAGGALGLQNLQITNDLQSGVGVNAVKAFGKLVSVVFADTFGVPRRQSLTVRANPSVATRYSLAFYDTQGATLLALQEPSAIQTIGGFGNSTTIPMDTGANGVAFKLERTFP